MMENKEIFYHGSSCLFDKFDLSHALEGDGKIKFGYGVYVTSCYRSAAHYSACNENSDENYVYTVEVPAIGEDNFIAYGEPVKTEVLMRARNVLHLDIPEEVAGNGKAFRKFLAKQLSGKTDFSGEKAASEFLSSIGVDFIMWPYNWKNPAAGTNRAIFDAGKVKILRTDRVLVDSRKRFVEGSEMPVFIAPVNF